MKTVFASCLCVLFCLSVYSQGKSRSQKKGAVIRVASYNLRQNTPRDGVNAWPNRKATVNSLIRFHDFDIFGVQEAFKSMLEDIVTAGGYSYIGEGRDGGDAGEHSAIIYKTDRFEVLEQGNFWFSETPETVGKGWDATCCNRICSWGKFRDKVSKREFYFFNSHFDHQGRKARLESSKLLLTRIKAIAGKLPVFATGDYNAAPESEPIRTILADGMLEDARTLSVQPPYGTEGTYQAFRVDAAMNMKSRCDYIFVRKGIRIQKYGVLNDRPYGRCPSDHDPVLVVAEL